MICQETSLQVADNTGARRVKCIRVLGQGKQFAKVGDIIRVTVKEAQPSGIIKKGEIHHAVITNVTSFSNFEIGYYYSACPEENSRSPTLTRWNRNHRSAVVTQLYIDTIVTGKCEY